MRALGRLPELNVPEAFITRHPFPGDIIHSTLAGTALLTLYQARCVL